MTIYVVTSGCYSDYCIEAVYTDKDLAYAYANINTDRSVEEYETDTIRVEGVVHMQVQYNPSENCITVITPISSPGMRPERDYLYSENRFMFQCVLSERTKKDIEQHGTKSEILLKAAQDRWAWYKAEHMDEVEETMPEPVPVIDPEQGVHMFKVLVGLHNAKKIEEKQNADDR